MPTYFLLYPQVKFTTIFLIIYGLEMGYKQLVNTYVQVIKSFLKGGFYNENT